MIGTAGWQRILDTPGLRWLKVNPERVSMSRLASGRLIWHFLVRFCGAAGLRSTIDYA